MMSHRSTKVDAGLIVVVTLKLRLGLEAVVETGGASSPGSFRGRVRAARCSDRSEQLLWLGLREGRNLGDSVWFDVPTRGRAGGT
jgi:hypothetical protein